MGWSNRIASGNHRVLVLRGAADSGVVAGHTFDEIATSRMDLNGDDRIDVSDATLLLRWVVSLDSPAEAERREADLNETERLDAGDVIRVLQRVVGLR